MARLPHPSELPRLLRTVALLTPRQVLSRFVLRGSRALIAAAPGAAQHLMWRPAMRSGGGWPASFQAIDGKLAEGFPSAEANSRGVFCFLNDMRDLGDPPDWSVPGASRLWRFNLHYFTWAWSFRAHPDREWARWEFERLWRSWEATATFGKRDAWGPYPVSLRSWALCGIYDDLIAVGPAQKRVLESLRLHASFLRANVEHDVGGNHVIKNLKALIALGVFFGDHRMERRAVSALVDQLSKQVLPDGGHFELSPSYHCQVLGDLIDVQGLLAATSRPQVHRMLDSAVQSMGEWLSAIVLPDGDVPLFNDGALVGASLLALLGIEPAAVEPITALDSSGYVVLRPSPRLHVVMDVGLPSPDALPAHAHADCLSVQISVDGKRFLIDTGTSTYEAGELRTYERSTRAHNSLTVDGKDQTELWGAFRAGRRARPMLLAIEENGHNLTVSASHDGYRHLKGAPVHKRTLHANPHAVEIIDEVIGSGTHTVIVHSHLAPGLTCDPAASGGYQAGNVCVRTTLDGSYVTSTMRLRQGWCAMNFGERQPVQVVECEVTGRLPMRFKTVIWLKDGTIINPP